MIKEIKKNYWTRFVKNFNSDNQYRCAQVCVFNQDQQELELLNETPFLGIKICKRGGKFGSVEFYAGRPDPDFIDVPIVAVNQPEKMSVDYDENGQVRYLSIISNDGSSASLSLNGEKYELFQSYKKQIAYFISERHGFTPGNDINDWLEAEKKISEVEKILG